eukprot:PhF_6_TR3391/c0_g1_i1/m.4846/K15341/DCLRE1B, SNM1B; DNA cross-link repair 1B protein
MRIQHLPISFDCFFPSDGISIFLLTHMHTDHTHGLHNTWHHGPIYCHRITQALLLLKYPAIAPFLRPLTPDVPETIFPGIELICYETLHIPGSVMFLVRSSVIGSVLITGDFRCRTETLLRIPPRSIDHVVLDDTWLFNKRPMVTHEHVVDMLVGIPQRMCEETGHTACILVISLRNQFGKEDVVAAVASELKCVIVVSSERLEMLTAVHRADNNFPIHLFTVHTPTTTTTTTANNQPQRYCSYIIIADSRD